MIIFDCRDLDKCIEGITYVQLSKMEEKYARFLRVHIQKYVDR